MYYIVNEENKVIDIVPEHPGHDDYIGCSDLTSKEDAERVATEINEAQDNDHYVACDEGPYVYPRYKVQKRPLVGEKVSYAFNGDYYPDGEIVKISDSFRVITTDTGSKYYRRKQTGTWIRKGMWSLVSGHISRLNPSF